MEHVAAIDLGSDTSVACRVSTRSLRSEILRNDLSNEKTPMCISFAGGHRSFGEVAVQLKTTNKDLSIESLLKFVDYAHRSPEERQAGSFQPLVGKFETHDQYGHLYKVEVDGKEYQLHGEQILGMMLGKLDSFAKIEGAQVPMAIVIPDSFTDSQKQAVRDAAKMGKVDMKLLVTRMEAAAMDYGTKRSSETLDGSAVLIVDVGHAYASVAIYEWEGKKGTKVFSSCIEGVGGEAIEHAILAHLQHDLRSRKNVEVPIGSKGAVRFMTQIRKLKESLSAVNEASITVEALVEDEDIKFSMTRDELENACASIKEKMKNIITEAFSACSEETLAKLSQCELIGGGMRVPFIKEAIKAGASKEISLAYTMDSMSSIANGAALCCAKLAQPVAAGVVRPALEALAQIEIEDERLPVIPESSEEGDDEEEKGLEKITLEIRSQAPSLLTEEKLNEAEAMEQTFREKDQKIRALHHAKNLLESRIFEARSLASGSRPHSDLVDKQVCTDAADEFEAWLFDYETGGSSPDVTLENFEDKLAELNAKLAPACKAYDDKLAEIKAAQDAEMEVEAQRAAEELEANGGKEDHDQRKLKKPERMRKVMLNKEEGNTLFKDGNYDAAILRYIRALQHCDKFFDLSPDDTKEIDAIKLSLHLNSAQGYLKLKKFQEASKSAEKALEIQSDSVKALFRLAFAQENLKEFSKAKKNLLQAKELDAEDVAISKLLDRVNAQLKREEAKRRAMAKRMFG